MEQDVHWQQRFSNYKKALKKLSTAIVLISGSALDQLEVIDETAWVDKESINEILKEGLVQRFEYTYELAWNAMKDYAEFQGNTSIAGSRDATREAFKMNLLDNADVWMDMLESRKLSSHTYNSATADEIVTKIIKLYQPLLLAFQEKMDSLLSK